MMNAQCVFVKKKSAFYLFFIPNYYIVLNYKQIIFLKFQGI